MTITAGNTVLVDRLRKKIIQGSGSSPTLPTPASMTALPVRAPVKGVFFPDQESDPPIEPRLHLEIQFFLDRAYSVSLGVFTTLNSAFLPYARLLSRNPATPGDFAVSFPNEGLHAWWGWKTNQFSYPERVPLGEMGSQSMVMVQELVDASLLSQAPLTWAARYVNVESGAVGGYSDWDFGVVGYVSV